MSRAIKPWSRSFGRVSSQCVRCRDPVCSPTLIRSRRTLEVHNRTLLWVKNDRTIAGQPFISNNASEYIRRKSLRPYSTRKENEAKQDSKELGKKPLLSKRILDSLPTHENIYTIPNILTCSRLVAAPIIGYLTLNEQHVAALALFIYAGATDLVDGWIARRWNLQTVVGTVLDPMADKTLMTVLTVSLAMKGAMPLPLAALILGRDVLLSLAAIYYRYISLPPPKTLARYWDFSLPSAEVHPTGISKVNTALQLALIGWTMGTMAVGGDLGWWGPEGALKFMWYLVATTTIWSGASYIYTKDAVKILTSRRAK
ncbi:MAG: hypothetical protein LQ338_003640 [Usnochroma carphineum]|nr:MAG: hypothetical protein LQ338_003640 [Usnochroma carphineum]